MLVAPRDVRAMTDGLELLLRDPTLRARLGDEARRTVVEGFDAWENAAQLASMFRRIGVGAWRPSA
jgi:glycosyltransferase involved in cell wall biosynthesis